MTGRRGETGRTADRTYDDRTYDDRTYDDRTYDDRGAALIVAIGFVVMIGAISAGLASLVTSSMNNRATLQVVRNREYAADGAIEDTVAELRGRIDDGTTRCGDPGGSSSSAVNALVIRVDWHPACETVLGADGVVLVQRNVEFEACPDEGRACDAAQVIIRAQVNFQQDASGVVTKTYVQSWSVDR